MELLHFSENEYQEDDNLQDIVGIRGKNVMELAALKAPIAPGFIIPSELIWKKNVLEDVGSDTLKAAIKKIESGTGKGFGSVSSPMFLKIVVSPSIQIKALSSVHTIGINDEVVKSFAAASGEDFAYNEYFFFMCSIASRFMGKKKKDFEELKKSFNGSVKELCQLCREKLVPDFPQEGYQQLQLVLDCLSKEYTSDITNEDIEAGIIVQAMVYGNTGGNSYNGIVYSRDIVSGKDEMHGTFGRNEFDTDVAKGTELHKIGDQYYDELKALVTQLEEKYLDIRKVKFIIEEGKLWLVDQSPVEEKSTQAEIRTLLDLSNKGLISKEKLATAVPPNQIQDLLHPVIDYKSVGDIPKISGGLTGSPGAVIGQICFSTKKLVAEHRRISISGQNPCLILMIEHTDAEDVEAIELGCGVIASVGGYSSHAPVVSRSLHKPCALFPDIEFGDGYAVIGGNRVKEMDTISLEAPTYTSPTIWLGKTKLILPDTTANGLEEYLAAISDLTGDFYVTALIDKLSDASVALRFGAQGIGMCSIDGIIRSSKSLEIFQELLLLVNQPKYFDKVAAQFTEAIQPSFEELIDKVDGYRMVMQLIEGPPLMFFPNTKVAREKIINRIASKHSGLKAEDLWSLLNQMQSINPLMGMRGSRMGVNYPNLYAMQLVPLLRAAYQVSKKKRVCLGVCVPGVTGDAELRFLKYGRSIESSLIGGMRQVVEDLLKEWRIPALPFEFNIGAVIELPAAAMMAGHLAKQSDFFLVDAMKLTQNASGITTEDLNVFLPSFTQYDIWKDNPFEVFPKPVKELISIAVHLGRLTRPDLQIGICSDSIQDPNNMEFALKSRVHFVAARPQGIPVARLAAVQYMLKNKRTSNN